MQKLTLLSALFSVSVIIAQPTATNVPYGTHSNQKLDYTTAANPNSPIMMVIHGGGWMAGNKSDPAFTNVAQLFRNAGYAVVNINYRLSNDVGYPGYPAIPSDVACALAWTKSNAALIKGDSSRILMYGNSAGAYLAALHGLTHPSSLLAGCGHVSGLKVSGVIASNPPVNFTHINPARYAEIKPMVKDSATYWKAADPINNLLPGSAVKFLILVGQNDNFLGTQQSIVFNDSMSKYNYCKRFYIIPGGDHNSLLNNLSATDPLFNLMKNWSDSLWLNQLCPGTTGIDERGSDIYTTQFYPNPVRENLILARVGAGGSPEVSVYDLLGKLQTVGVSSRVVEVTNLPAGIYFLQVSNGSKVTFNKFIKE
jgi:acetyl esterase/lipase